MSLSGRSFKHRPKVKQSPADIMKRIKDEKGKQQYEELKKEFSEAMEERSQELEKFVQQVFKEISKINDPFSSMPKSALTEVDVAKAGLYASIGIAKELAQSHVDIFDHSQLHDPFTIGSYRVDESNIGDAKVMQFDEKTGQIIFAKVNIGAPGKDGYTPRKGIDYFDGKDGRDGKDGKSIVGPMGPMGLDGDASGMVTEHLQTFDHNLLHSPFQLGTLMVDETNLADGATLQYDLKQKKLVYRVVKGGGGNFQGTWGSPGPAGAAGVAGADGPNNITGATSTTLIGLLYGNASLVGARTLTGTSNRITVTNGTGVSGNPTVDISTSYVGQATITTLGTITTGVWNGTAITVANGGTGAGSFTAGRLLIGAGTSAITTDSVLFWDTTNHYLGIGTASPAHPLHVVAAGYTLPTVSINDGYYQYNIGYGSASYGGPNSDFLSIYRQSVTTYINHKSGGFYFRINGTDAFHHDTSSLLNDTVGYIGVSSNSGGILLGQNGDIVSNNNEVQMRGNTNKPFVFYGNATIGTLSQSGSELMRLQVGSPHVNFSQTNSSYHLISGTLLSGRVVFRINNDGTVMIPDAASGFLNTLTYKDNGGAGTGAELRIKRSYIAQNYGYGAQLALEDVGNGVTPAAYIKYESAYFIVNRSDLNFYAQVGKVIRMPWNGGIECFTGGAFAVDDQSNVGGVFSIPSYTYASPGGPAQRATCFSIYTYTVNTSGGTGPIKEAAGMYVEAAPVISGSSATIGTWGMWIDSGASRFDGNLEQWGDSTVQPRQQHTVVPSWVVSTDASRTARVIHNVYDTAAREAMRMEASGSAAMIGFLGATAVAQRANTVSLETVLSDFGFRASGTAAPLAIGTLTMTDATNIIVGSTTGTKIGTATTQKLAFYNATPIVQPSAYTQTYSTADKTHANLTSATLTDNTAGTANTTLQALADGTVYANDVAAIRNNFADLAASNNAIIVDLTDLKQLANSIIDDLQALGLVG